MFVLITGAAGGLGRVFAAACAKRGYALFLTDINEAGLKFIERGITSRYDVPVITSTCDLTDAAQVDALFAFAYERGIYFDMLLNVAGVDFEGGFSERSAQSVTSIVRLNVEATLRITHGALAARVPEKPFYIVFVSSLASFYPMPLKATYAASKGFLREFAFALGKELESDGVKVLTLCPGGLATTPEALSGITAQGFWGNVTTNRLETVTQTTLSRVLRGKTLFIPGLINRVLCFLGAIVPKKLVAKLIYSRWKAAQKQWLSVPAKSN